MDQNAPPTVPSQHSTVKVDARDQITKQLTAGQTGDGSLFSQLAANPFFTAVSPMRAVTVCLGQKADCGHRDLD